MPGDEALKARLPGGSQEPGRGERSRIFSLAGNVSGKAIYEASATRWWSYADLRNLVGEWCGYFNSPSKVLVFDFCRNDIRSIATLLASQEAGHATALLDDGVADESQRPI